jgi:hypothetical protein
MRYDWDFCSITIVCTKNRKTSHKHHALPTLILLLSVACLAQQPNGTPAPDPPAKETGSTGNWVATIPAGTRISLQVMHPIATRLAQTGDGIDLQVTMPVNAGDKVVIPPGAYIKGVLEKLTQKHDRTELRIYLNSLVWPNGYSLAVTDHPEVITTVPGSIYEHTDYDNPGHGKAAAVLLGSTFWRHGDRRTCRRKFALNQQPSKCSRSTLRLSSIALSCSATAELARSARSQLEFWTSKRSCDWRCCGFGSRTGHSSNDVQARPQHHS